MEHGGASGFFEMLCRRVLVGEDIQGYRDNAKGTGQRVVVLYSTRQREGSCMEEGKEKALVYPYCG